jgi:hypothetical protein
MKHPISGLKWFSDNGRAIEARSGRRKGLTAVKIIAAPTREQGQDFVVVLVKDRVIQDPTERDSLIRASEQQFGVRAALMGEQQKKTYGPQDIVKWLEGIAFEQLPWREFSLN